MSWNKDRSVILSQVSTRVIMVLAVMLGVALPFFRTGGIYLGRMSVAATDVLPLMLVYYAFCIPAFVALFSLDRLLAAIKRDEVFTEGNVRYLRIISWACFAAAFVLLAGSLVLHILFLALAILAIFFGVVLRVVKNLFAAAVELQDENNYTI
ncbi:MAG: DUF2975 domain-containing protein [Coriobacteriales bacterium]|jgi:hypothetical protein|nr:DUF2975 domain-containing protein [Coriobacteriales bacterium]